MADDRAGPAQPIHMHAPSVIIFRISNARPERVNAHLESVLRDVAVALALGDGAIVAVEDERRRLRKLPIGA
jgi:hypothetical protein